MDRRARQAVRQANASPNDLDAQIQAGVMLMRARERSEARVFIERAINLFKADLPKQLDQMKAQERRKYLDAGGCPVCHGTGEFMFKGQRRRCPNEIGKLCTIPKRKKLGQLRDILAKVTEVPGAQDRLKELNALLGEDAFAYIRTPARFILSA